MKKILLHEMIISCIKLQLPPEPLTRALPSPDPRSLCSQLNLLNPLPWTKFLGRPLVGLHWFEKPHISQLYKDTEYIISKLIGYVTFVVSNKMNFKKPVLNFYSRSLFFCDIHSNCEPWSLWFNINHEEQLPDICLFHEYSSHNALLKYWN